MTRTDVHAPSSPDFDPQAYRCVGVFDNAPEWSSPAERKFQMTLVNSLIADGYRSGHGSSDNCGHCGARIRYAALMVRDDVHEFIYIGETCLDGRFEMTKGEFDTLRKNAALDREAHAKREALAAMYAESPILVLATYSDNIKNVGLEFETDEDGWTTEKRNSSFAMKTRTGKQFSIIYDISEKIIRYGSVSEAQVALVARLFGQIEEAARRLATRDADTAALIATGIVAPEGRTVVTGVVAAQKAIEGDYGVSYKMLVVTAAGWRVWVTEPASISPSKGDTVRFTATLTRSNDDALFAFGSRPAKAEVLVSAYQESE